MFPRDPTRTIRTADTTDHPRLRRLQTLLREPCPELLPYGLSAGTVLVSTAECRARSDVVGYVLATHGSDTHIAELAVDPARRREGRAAALLRALLSRLPDGERVTLCVAPENGPARALYRSAGFEHVETDGSGFDDGPALILARRA